MKVLLSIGKFSVNISFEGWLAHRRRFSSKIEKWQVLLVVKKFLVYFGYHVTSALKNSVNEIESAVGFDRLKDSGHQFLSKEKEIGIRRCHPFGTHDVQVVNVGALEIILFKDELSYLNEEWNRRFVVQSVTNVKYSIAARPWMWGILM